MGVRPLPAWPLIRLDAVKNATLHKTMKIILSVTSVLAVLALAALPAGATTYTDATGDNYGTAEVDISSVTMTNDASNLIITINLTNTATISQYPNYLVGIQIGSGAGGQTLINNTGSGVNAGNPWGKTVGISSGENFFIAVYPNGPSWTGAAALFQYSSATGWSQVGGTTPVTEVASGAPSIKFSVPLSGLGLSAGNTFKFDVWTTYASPGGQGAYDALDSSVQAAGAPLAGAIYDSATATGSTLANYTVAAASGYQVKFTFTVSMAAPIIQGNFSIGGNTLYAFGSFDPAGTGWNNGGVQLTNVPGTSNYVGTFVTNNLSLGTAVQYKYAINGFGGTWEGNVGPNNSQNRTFTLTNVNQTLPLDLWNNITNPYTSFAVKFQVDMLVEYALGDFDPSLGDTVFVAGTWDWSGTAMELFQTANPYIYTGTVALAYSPGTLIDYKYAMNQGIPPNSWEINGVGPNGADNRQFALNGATNLPGVYFNNYTNLGPVTISGSGAQTVLSWASGSNANNHIRLQNATNLLGGWVDVVPNTQGQSAVTNDFGTAPRFFRLIGP